MYTSTTINPTAKTVNSSKRIFLNRKEQRSIIKGSNPLDSAHDQVEANIYYTNIPLDGKSTKDIKKAHEITEQVVKTVIQEKSLGDVKVVTKVREKDQVIVSDILFNQVPSEEEDKVAEEKKIWHPLKMETLHTLIAYPEIGDYIPLNDFQIDQLSDYLNIDA